MCVRQAQVVVFHPSQRETLGLNKNLSIPVTMAMHTHRLTFQQETYVCKCTGKTETERASGPQNDMRQTDYTHGNKARKGKTGKDRNKEAKAKTVYMKEE